MASVDARLGGRHVGCGNLHDLDGAFNPLFIELDGRLLGLEILDHLGNEEGGESIAPLHAIADIDIPFLDIGADLGINRRPLEALDEAGLTDDAHDLAELGLDDVNDWRFGDRGFCALLFVTAT